MTSRNHKRSPSAGLVLSSAHAENVKLNDRGIFDAIPSTPSHHTRSNQSLEITRPNRERARSSPRKPAIHRQVSSQDDGKSMHKKTKSSISLKSLVGGDKDNKHSSQDTSQESKPKKSKSSTNLSALLSRPRSSKAQKPEPTSTIKDKENQMPPSSAGSDPPPIWAQYASQPPQETSNATRIRLNDRMSVDEQVALYTPRDYSPSKQRNFGDYHQPTLTKRHEPKPRPKSAYLPSAPSFSAFADTLSGRRKASHDRGVPAGSRRDLISTQRNSADDKRRGSLEQDCSSRRPSGEVRRVSSELFNNGVTMAKRGVKVMAAVAAFNAKSKEQEKEVKIDVKVIDSAFEALLVSPIWSAKALGKRLIMDDRIRETFPKTCGRK